MKIFRLGLLLIYIVTHIMGTDGINSEQIQPILASLSSSPVQWPQYPAIKCIDGDKNNFCHTDKEKYPWIYLDLGKSVTVTKITISNRKNCCGDRLKDVDVRLTDEPPTTARQPFKGGTTVGYFEEIGETKSIETNSAGRYIVIIQNSRGRHDAEYMNIGEIEVYGCNGSASDVSAQLKAKLSEFPDAVGLAGYAVSQEGNIWSIGSAGERINGKMQPLTATGDTRFQIGSVTKSMTAVLLATLIEEGTIPNGWEATLGAVIPSASQGTPYATVTLRQLLGMQSGLARNNPVVDLSGKTLRQQRAEITADAMKSTPKSIPGTSYLYSNWGYIVAGHIVEKYTDNTWESAIKNRLFAPLGICFGDRPFTGAPNDDISPWGTKSDGTACDPSMSVCDTGALRGPAGSFSGPNAAMAAYLGWHIRCHNGQDKTGILSRESCQHLHQPANRAVHVSYGYGLSCFTRSWAGGDGLTCTHSGNNGLNHYIMWMGFGIKKAFAVFTNQKNDKTWEMLDQAVYGLIQQASSQPEAQNQCKVPSSYICP